MENYKYKWLLFDADGTLLDYNKSEKQALSVTFKSFELDFQAEYLEKYRKINAKLWSELENSTISSEKLRVKRFEILFSDLALDINPISFSNKYLKSLSQTDFLIKNTLEVLNKLNRNFKLAIITNGIKNVQNGRFRQTKLYNFFKHIIISEEIGHAKPSKLFFDYTFDKINFHTKNEILVIGDSLKSDILGGNQSDIDTCWFNPSNLTNKTGIEPTYELNNLKELIDIVR